MLVHFTTVTNDTWIKTTRLYQSGGGGKRREEEEGGREEVLGETFQKAKKKKTSKGILTVFNLCTCASFKTFLTQEQEQVGP